MQVLKFGGSSVANAENMSKVVDIVTKAVDRDRTILVTSAISGCTDTPERIGENIQVKHVFRRNHQHKSHIPKS